MSEETQNTLQEEEENGDDSIFIENPSTSPYDLVLQQNGTALPGVPTPWESQSFDYPTEPTPIGRIMRAISSVQDKCTAMPRNIILKSPTQLVIIGKALFLCLVGASLLFLAYRRVSYFPGLLFCIKLVTIASSFLKTKISGSLKEAFFVFSIVINLILIAIAAYLIATLEFSIDRNFVLQSSNIFTCLILLFFLTEFPQSIRPLNIINLLLLNLVAAIFFQRHITGKMIIKSLSWVLEKIISYADSGSLWIYGGMEGDASSFLCSVFSTHILFSAILKVFHSFRTFNFLIEFFALPLAALSGISFLDCQSFLESFLFSNLDEEEDRRVENLNSCKKLAKFSSEFGSILLSNLIMFAKMTIDSENLIMCFLMSVFIHLLINNFVLPESRRLDLPGKIKSRSSPKPVIEELLDGACGAISSCLRLSGLILCTIPTLELFKSLFDFFYELVGEKLNLPELDALDLLGVIFSPMCVASGVPDDEAAFCGKLTGSNIFFGNFVSFQFLAEGKSHREDGRPKCDCEGRVHWATEKSELIITSLLLGSYFIGKLFQAKRTKKDYRQTKCAFWIAIVGVYMRTNIISLVYEDPFQISDGNLTVTDFSCGNLKLTLADHFSYSHDLCHFYTDYQPLLREETPKIVLDTLDQIKKKENKDKLRELKKDLPPKSASDGFADLEIIKADFNPSNFNDLMKKMKLDNIIQDDPECTSETGDDCKND